MIAKTLAYRRQFALVQSLRSEFFNRTRRPSRTIFEDINAVPAEFLNGRLEQKGLGWRVRVTHGVGYEFHAA